MMTWSAKLAETRAVEPGAQFRLPHQNDLQQLAVVQFEIRQKPHLFEQFVGEILRLVNDQHHILALLDLIEQKIVDGRKRVMPVQIFDVQTEFRANGPHQFIRIQHRVEDDGDGKINVELPKHRTADRGLARADFAGKLHKTLALPNAVKQMVVRLAMLLALKQEARVRREVERRLL